MTRPRPPLTLVADRALVEAFAVALVVVAACWAALQPSAASGPAVRPLACSPMEVGR